MNILWPNDYILSGLHDIFCIRTYSLTTFAKEVFWSEAPVKLWQNEHFVTKWLHIKWFRWHFLAKFCSRTEFFLYVKGYPSVSQESIMIFCFCLLQPKIWIFNTIILFYWPYLVVIHLITNPKKCRINNVLCMGSAEQYGSKLNYT